MRCFHCLVGAWIGLTPTTKSGGANAVWVTQFTVAAEMLPLPSSAVRTEMPYGIIRKTVFFWSGFISFSDQVLDHDNSSSSAFASFRSRVSKPSGNHRSDEIVSLVPLSLIAPKLRHAYRPHLLSRFRVLLTRATGTAVVSNSKRQFNRLEAHRPPYARRWHEGSILAQVRELTACGAQLTTTRG